MNFMSAASWGQSIPISDHFDGNRFFHKWGDSDKSFFQLIKWQLTKDRKEWPKWVENKAQPAFASDLKLQDLEVTFINHSTVYFRHMGFGVLTDPQFSERASPATFAGPRRVRAPGVPLKELPQVDFVLVSHNHYDHLDIPSLKALKEQYDPMFFVPLGDKKLLNKNGITKVQELDWWQEVILAPDFRLIFTPAKHWSARGVFDKNKSLWGGYLLKTSFQQIYFAGDTGYCDVFKEIFAKYGAPSFAMIPIGAYEPRWFMAGAHVNPHEAIQIHKDLHAKKSMAIHFGTWQLTDEGIDDPIHALEKGRMDFGLRKDEFLVFEAGETKLLR